MMEEGECMILCNRNSSIQTDKNYLEKIKDDYHYTLYLDDLPGALINRNEEEQQAEKFSSDIPIGYISKEGDGISYLYNHLDMTISVHETLDDPFSFRIVGFKVEPMS